MYIKLYIRIFSLVLSMVVYGLVQGAPQMFVWNCDGCEYGTRVSKAGEFISIS